MNIETILPDLASAAATELRQDDIVVDRLEPLRTTGLAHDHVAITGTDMLLRVPRQSQMRLGARRNLVYQAACFTRLAASGHTPWLHAVIPPSEALPMGALIVERIKGSVPQSANQLNGLAEALAAIHRLRIPPEDSRNPLIDQADPMAETLSEVMSQAEYLEEAAPHPDSLGMIRQALTQAKKDCETLGTAPKTLISFDAHPGNFLVGPGSRAYLVDLEKVRYGGPGFDLAHATLYTSTTWDISCHVTPSKKEIEDFYVTWRAGMPKDLADGLEPFLLPMRRLMWLWSITWCAKWRVESQKASRTEKHIAKDTEDWSAENIDPSLVTHVADRVDHYLTPEIVARVQEDWQ